MPGWEMNHVLLPTASRRELVDRKLVGRSNVTLYGTRQTFLVTMSAKEEQLLAC